MKQTFRDRLQLLMKGERPYTWARKVGIEKGLFQYYWQKGKIPTFENLLKIQNFTGCSLDWLLTGRAVAIDQIENLPMIREDSPVYGEMNLRRSESLELVKKLYASRNEEDIALLEGILGKLAPEGAAKKKGGKK
ncbi:MAG: hypothetical protein HQK87_00960 [Nitrospinae bacterium]|nr:hypothetical protein [Nitrospinota bacterium]